MLVHDILIMIGLSTNQYSEECEVKWDITDFQSLMEDGGVRGDAYRTLSCLRNENPEKVKENKLNAIVEADEMMAGGPARGIISQRQALRHSRVRSIPARVALMLA